MMDSRKLSDYIKEIEDQSKKRSDLIAKKELTIDAMLLSILKSLKDITEKRVSVDSYIDVEEESSESHRVLLNHVKDTDEIFQVIEDLCKDIIEIRR